MADNEYPVGFYFKLSFNGEDAAFQSVSGLAKETALKEVISGGENRFKYRLPETTTSQNLVLKRAMVSNGSGLADWCSASMDDGLVGGIFTNNVIVSLLDSKGQTYKSWTVYNAYPVKYSISDFKSQENEIVIENIELAYTYFEITDSDLFGNLF